MPGACHASLSKNTKINSLAQRFKSIASVSGRSGKNLKNKLLIKLTTAIRSCVMKK